MTFHNNHRSKVPQKSPKQLPALPCQLSSSHCRQHPSPLPFFRASTLQTLAGGPRDTDNQAQSPAQEGAGTCEDSAIHNDTGRESGETPHQLGLPADVLILHLAPFQPHLLPSPERDPRWRFLQGPTPLTHQQSSPLLSPLTQTAPSRTILAVSSAPPKSRPEVHAVSDATQLPFLLGQP